MSKQDLELIYSALWLLLKHDAVSPNMIDDIEDRLKELKESESAKS